MGTIAELMGDSIPSIWGAGLKVRSWWSEQGWRIPGSFSRRFPQISARILTFQLGEEPDQVTWKLSLSGEYTVDSYYNKFRKRRSRVGWDNLVWIPHLPPRFSFCQWLLRKDALKTRMMLSHRGLGMELDCPICNAQVEDVNHLFFRCSYSNLIWKQVLAEHGVQRNPGSWGCERRWLKTNCRGRSRRSHKLKVAIACTAYYIWQERNLRIFQQKSRGQEVLTRVIMRYCNLLC